jgi:elongation factor Ts
MIKKLREQTGASLKDCKEALKDAGGDIERAKRLLKNCGQMGGWGEGQ